MRVGLILLLVSVITVSPVLVALVSYRDNLMALFMPTESTMNALGEFTRTIPSIEYLNYEIINPERSIRVNLKISSSYDLELKLNSLTLTAYCHEHDTFLGDVFGENTPLAIPVKGSAILSLKVTFSLEGKNDVDIYHRDMANLYLDLRELNIDIHGLEIDYTEFLEVGPIEIPS